MTPGIELAVAVVLLLVLAVLAFGKVRVEAVVNSPEEVVLSKQKLTKETKRDEPEKQDNPSYRGEATKSNKEAELLNDESTKQERVPSNSTLGEQIYELFKSKRQKGKGKQFTKGKRKRAQKTENLNAIFNRETRAYAAPSWIILQFLQPEDILSMAYASPLFWRDMVWHVDSLSTRYPIHHNNEQKKREESILNQVLAMISQPEMNISAIHIVLDTFFKVGSPQLGIRFLDRVSSHLQRSDSGKSTLTSSLDLRQAHSTTIVKLARLNLVAEAESLAKAWFRMVKTNDLSNSAVPPLTPSLCNEICYHLLVADWHRSRPAKTNSQNGESFSSACDHILLSEDYRTLRLQSQFDCQAAFESFLSLYGKFQNGSSFFKDPAGYVLSTLSQIESKISKGQVPGREEKQNKSVTENSTLPLKEEDQIGSSVGEWPSQSQSNFRTRPDSRMIDRISHKAQTASYKTPKSNKKSKQSALQQDKSSPRSVKANSQQQKPRFSPRAKSFHGKKAKDTQIKDISSPSFSDAFEKRFSAPSSPLSSASSSCSSTASPLPFFYNNTRKPSLGVSIEQKADSYDDLRLPRQQMPSYGHVRLCKNQVQPRFDGEEPSFTLHECNTQPPPEPLPPIYSKEPLSPYFDMPQTSPQQHQITRGDVVSDFFSSCDTDCKNQYDNDEICISETSVDLSFLNF